MTDQPPESLTLSQAFALEEDSYRRLKLERQNARNNADPIEPSVDEYKEQIAILLQDIVALRTQLAELLTEKVARDQPKADDIGKR